MENKSICYDNEYDFSASVCEKATLADISPEAVDIFRTRCIQKNSSETANSNSSETANSGEQLLRDVGAITPDGITYAALILFGTEAGLRKHLSQSEIIFEYRHSNRPGPASAREEFKVGLFSCFDRLWELIALRNDLNFYQEGFFMIPIPSYNRLVVSEAILNAVSHRNYQLSGSIIIKQYVDRLDIENPGGFLKGVTKENLLYRQAPRNRLITELLERSGLVLRAGQGMDLIYSLCIKESKELPNFLDSDEWAFRMRLSGGRIDGRFLSILKKIENVMVRALSVEELMAINSLYWHEDAGLDLDKYMIRLGEMAI
jgi:ATP-dependent DNA helicase RecG